MSQDVAGAVFEPFWLGFPHSSGKMIWLYLDYAITLATNDTKVAQKAYNIKLHFKFISKAIISFKATKDAV
jgi:hypothetical protein